MRIHTGCCITSAATYSPTPQGSTIGAGGLNFSVRNGKRWTPVAITTDIIFPGKTLGKRQKEAVKEAFG